MRWSRGQHRELRGRLTGMRTILALLAAMVLVSVGCIGAEARGGSREEAMGLADEFLSAVKDNDADRAWSLVYPPNRTARFEDDRSRFDAIVQQIDLSNAVWEVTNAGEHDGHHHVTLRLDPLEVDAALGAFIQVVESDGVAANAQMVVDIEPFGGSRGVLGG